MGNSILRAKSEIILVGREMLKKGLVAGTWGNLSSRIEGTEFVAITPSGKSYESITPENIPVVDMEGNLVEGNLKPSSELLLHLSIYKNRKDVEAIVHVHSVFASACAVSHVTIPPIIEDLAQVIGGSVDVAKYALPGTAELASNAVKALQNKFAVLLANHGVVGCGKTPDEALLVCELVEKAAQIFIYSKQIGQPVILDSSDVDVMHANYLKHYRKLQGEGS